MSGEELIVRIEEIEKLIKVNNLKDAQLKLGYIKDDIMLYRFNSL
jgi:hypothetical protein